MRGNTIYCIGLHRTASRLYQTTSDKYSKTASESIYYSRLHELSRRCSEMQLTNILGPMQLTNILFDVRCS